MSITARSFGKPGAAWHISSGSEVWYRYLCHRRQ